MRIGKSVLWDLYLATLFMVYGDCVPFYTRADLAQHNDERLHLQSRTKRDIGVDYCDRYNDSDQGPYTGGALSNITNQSLYFYRDCVLAICWENGNSSPLYCPLSVVRVDSPIGSYAEICVPGTQDDSQNNWPSQCTDYANDVASLSCSRVWCATSTVSAVATTTISAIDFTSSFSGTVTRYHAETSSIVQSPITTSNVPYPTETVVKRNKSFVKRQNATITSAVVNQALQFSIPDTLSLVFVTHLTAVSVIIYDTDISPTTQAFYTIPPYNTTHNMTFFLPSPPIPTNSNSPSPSNNPTTMTPIITPMPTSLTIGSLNSLQADNIQALYSYVQTAIPQTDATVPASQCFLHPDTVVKYTTPAWYTQMPTVAQSFIKSINIDNTMACMPGSGTGTPIREAAAVFGPGFNDTPDISKPGLSTGRKVGVGLGILVALILVSGIASLVVWWKQSGRASRLNVSGVFGRRMKMVSEKERMSRYGPLRGAETGYMGYGATVVGGGGENREHVDAGITAHNPLLPVEAMGDQDYGNRQALTELPLVAQGNMTFHGLGDGTNTINRTYRQQPNRAGTLQGFLGGIKYQRMQSGDPRNPTSNLVVKNEAQERAGDDSALAAVRVGPRATSRRKPVGSSIRVSTRDMTEPSQPASSTAPEYISPTQRIARTPPTFQGADQKRSSYSPYRADATISPGSATTTNTNYRDYRHQDVPNNGGQSYRGLMSGSISTISAESKRASREGLLSVTPPPPVGTPFSFEETGWTEERRDANRYDLYRR